MNQDWTYRKLGEACVLTMGQSPSSESYNKEGKGLPFFQGCSDFGKLNPTVKTFCNAPAKIAEIGDVLMSVRAPIGTLNIANVKCCIGRGLASFRALPNIDNMYLYYFLKHSNNCLQKLGTGSTFKAIGKESLYNFPIPVPPLAAQSRIVSELNLLQSIIDKQKAQLKELDNLAQAIFYDMFGNPMENVQGWEQEKLGDMCEVTSSKRVYQSEWKTTGVPFYRISDFSQLIENKQFNSELYISMDKYYELKRNNQVPVAGDILVTSRGTLGNCYIVKYDDCFYFQDGMITWLKNINNRLHPLFLTFLFKNSSFRKQIEKNQSGSTVAYLSISMLKKFALPVPPLPLQQSFATKIESTEKQKAAIGKSIEETQKLFDYTMDKYFG